MKKYLSAYAFLLPISFALVILDQWTKSLVRANLAYNETWMPIEWLAPYVRVVNWHNTGAAFGNISGHEWRFYGPCLCDNRFNNNLFSNHPSIGLLFSVSTQSSNGWRNG